MISQVELSRSLDAYGQHSAAMPASSSGSLPPAAKPAAPPDSPPPVSDVSISAEGVRQLQREAELAQERGVTHEAISRDAALAARMAHELAYRHELVALPPTAYSDIPASLYSGGTSPTSLAANLARAQADADRARLTRIALYEQEMAKGTPPAEIYNRLLGHSAGRPLAA